MHTFTQHPVKLFSVLVLAGGLFLGGMTGQAQAVDTKVYPGGSCYPARGNMNTTRFAYNAGRIENMDSSHYLYVVCPVIRDNTTMKGLREWGFSGKNADANRGLIKCTMWSKYWPTGQVLGRKSGIMKYTEGQPATIRIKTGPKKAGKTYLSLACSIPPVVLRNDGSKKSYITSYYIVEP